MGVMNFLSCSARRKFFNLRFPKEQEREDKEGEEEEKKEGEEKEKKEGEEEKDQTFSKRGVHKVKDLSVGTH